jgi:flagellar secretion chaperone FliS
VPVRNIQGSLEFFNILYKQTGDYMGYGKVLNQYRKTTIETAGKLDLVIMCYEKSILFLTQAKEHFKEKEFEKKAYKFQKALGIINELQRSLNMEQGGEIARNLDSLYSHITKRLLTGDIRKDLTAYDESIHILNELMEAWQAIKTEDDPQENVYAKRNMLQSGASCIAA